MLLILQLGADGHDDLANMDPGHCALGLPKGPSHTCLEPVGPGAGQHLVDTDHVEGVQADSDMKAILATAFHHVLVGTNPGSLQSFRGELLVLVRHHVATQRELIYFGLLPPQVKDAYLGIRDTSAEAGLRIGLVLTVPVTSGWTAAHGDTRVFGGAPKGKSNF